MFPAQILAAYFFACILVVLSPGPDNILAISRGLSQGRMAAILSSAGAGGGIMVHTLAATFGLAVLLQASASAFWVVKGVGAAYLIWLGVRAIRAKSLISFVPAAHQRPHRIFLTGLMSNDPEGEAELRLVNSGGRHPIAAHPRRLLGLLRAGDPDRMNHTIQMA